MSFGGNDSQGIVPHTYAPPHFLFATPRSQSRPLCLNLLSQLLISTYMESFVHSSQAKELILLLLQKAVTEVAIFDRLTLVSPVAIQELLIL